MVVWFSVRTEISPTGSWGQADFTFCLLAC